MSNRTALQSAILDYVAGAEAAGSVIDVTAAAIRLTSEYPQSGLTIDDVCHAIEKAAVARGATILSDGREKRASAG